ncbi:flagellar protein FliS [Candidatus Magnetomoraceae bacterium gMMP-15]
MINTDNDNLSNIADTKEKTLLMLLDGAVRFTRYARTGIERNDIKMRGENLSKIIPILIQLDCALDRNVDEELTQNLSCLYRYMMNRLTYANAKDDPQPFEEVEKLLTELKEGFDGAARETIQAMASQHSGKEQCACLTGGLNLGL